MKIRKANVGNNQIGVLIKTSEEPRFITLYGKWFSFELSACEVFEDKIVLSSSANPVVRDYQGRGIYYGKQLFVRADFRQLDTPYIIENMTVITEDDEYFCADNGIVLNMTGSNWDYQNFPKVPIFYHLPYYFYANDSKGVYIQNEEWHIEQSKTGIKTGQFIL